MLKPLQALAVFSPEMGQPARLGELVPALEQRREEGRGPSPCPRLAI